MHLDLYLHCNVPSLPNDSAQVAHLASITDNVDILALFAKGSAAITCGHNDIVRIYLEGLAILIGDRYAVRVNLGKFGLKMYGNLIGIEEITQEACICKAYSLDIDDIGLHFYNGRLLALQIELICYLTAGKTSADDDNVLADLFFAQQEVNSLNAVLGNTLNGQTNGICAGSNDIFISLDGGQVVDACIKFDLYGGELGQLAVIPGDEVAILLLKGGRSRRNKCAAQLITLFIKPEALFPSPAAIMSATTIVIAFGIPEEQIIKKNPNPSVRI